MFSIIKTREKYEHFDAWEFIHQMENFSQEILAKAQGAVRIHLRKCNRWLVVMVIKWIRRSTLKCKCKCKCKAAYVSLPYCLIHTKHIYYKRSRQSSPRGNFFPSLTALKTQEVLLFKEHRSSTIHYQPSSGACKDISKIYNQWCKI